jgi:UDP-glucose 6-dehydrogenase
MKIAVIGTGYVGLVAGTCFAETGNEVLCVDRDAAKIDALKAGRIPIYEPGLEEMVRRNVAEERLSFTTDTAAAVRESLVVFIAVGTPAGDDGSSDLSMVLSVAREIGKAMNGFKVIVDKSTVPVGTARRVAEAVRKETGHPFDVVSNPEFLKEGAAVDDFMKPDRVVVGCSDPKTAEIMKELYSPFVRTGKPILLMDVASAEMTKYAANAMLATRISFMNEIALLCEKVGADVDKVRQGVGTDARIGPAFLFPGAGYGGSCLVGSETVLVRRGGRTRLVRLDRLFGEELEAPDPGGAAAVQPRALETLSWDPLDSEFGFRPVSSLTRRRAAGVAITVRTDSGHEVTCTPDHPFVVRDAPQGPMRIVEAASLGPWAEVPCLPDTPGHPLIAVSPGAESAAAGGRSAIALRVRTGARPPHEGPPAASVIEEIASGTTLRIPHRNEWSRVLKVRTAPFQGWVYSVEVPGTETFVTTGGLVVHNCFPKDVKALLRTAAEAGVDLHTVKAAEAANERQKRVLFEKIRAHFGGDLKGRTFGLWGLAFKPRTDDMREAPSIPLVRALLEAGAKVRAADPEAVKEARKVFGDSITYCSKPYEALEGVDALVLVTEWNEFRHPDFERMKSLMKSPVVFDGRNIYAGRHLEEQGWTWYGIGVPRTAAREGKP